MSDQAVVDALRSQAPLVVIEAPAGCGKTHQGAEYARDAVPGSGRILIITHTHAACGVFAERTLGLGRQVEIRTIDSLITQIAAAYHEGLELPADVMAWTRRTPEGYKIAAAKVARLVARYPMIARALAERYPVVVCDEHQDASTDQHALVMALKTHGAIVRIFGDPMQHIYKDDAVEGSAPPCDWPSIISQADAYAELATPHRWTSGCSKLGAWTIAARRTLKAGGRLDLTRDLPSSVTVTIGENISQHPQRFQLDNPKAARDAVRKASSLLVLARHNHVTGSCRGLFYRRLPLWEGHTRPALDRLVDAMIGETDAVRLAQAACDFIGRTCKGFTPSTFGNQLIKEAATDCSTAKKGKSVHIQALARHVVARPDHRGVAAMLRALHALKRTERAFEDVEFDHSSEYWDAIRLGGFDDLETGLAEIANRRTYSRPKPAAKSISTIHKAKGLECDDVVLLSLDARSFPDKADARCLLYVALSRAKKRLHIVASQTAASPLVTI
jgi:DNA helicase-2/ATP-dependent DNA helicase PcrA